MIEISRILCPIDLSRGSERALQCANAMSRWYNAKLSVLYVKADWPLADMIPSIGATAVQTLATAIADRTTLEREARLMVERFTDGDRTELDFDEATDIRRQILTRVQDDKVDLVVMATRARDGAERYLGRSMTEDVLRDAPCPVMVVPPHVHEPALPPEVHFKTILCPVDFSDYSLDAVTYALSIAEEADARLTLVNVIDYLPELVDDVAPSDALVRSNVEKLRRTHLDSLIPEQARTYCSVETVVSAGSPGKQIAYLANTRGAELIVMGVHGRSRLSLGLFGSTTRTVMQTAECPVLTTRGRR